MKRSNAAKKVEPELQEDVVLQPPDGGSLPADLIPVKAGKERITLSDEEEDWCMEQLDGAMGKLTSEFSQDELKAITLGGRCTKKAVCNAAALVVYKGLEPFIARQIKRHEIDAQNEICNDIYQDVYLTIFETLLNWDSSKSKLITYYGQYISNCIVEAKYFSDAQMGTRYYNDLTKYVAKAKNAYALQGNTSPSSYEIRVWLDTHYHLKYSDQAIQECQRRNVGTAGGYNLAEYSGAPTSIEYMSPEIRYIEQVEIPEELRRIVDSMEVQHSLLLRAKLNLYQEHDYPGTIPKNVMREEFLRLLRQHALSQYQEHELTEELVGKIDAKLARLPDHYVSNLQADAERSLRARLAHKLDIHETLEQPKTVHTFRFTSKSLIASGRYRRPNEAELAQIAEFKKKK